MPIKLTRLTTVGFSLAGRWLLSGRGLDLDLDKIIAGKRDVLYAFAVDGALSYIGKTASTLRSRMQGYKTPPSSSQNGGTTNIKNNRNILDALAKGKTVSIFVLFDQSQQSHGEFCINLAAGLEDNLIRELSPPWNDHMSTKAETVQDLATSKLPQKTVRVGNEPRLSKPDFQMMLHRLLAEAASAGEIFIDVRAGNLHTRVGGYPAKGHSMPTCCSVMRDEIKTGDNVLSEPPKGKGASLLIRYRLPRA
ncbi:GIY-YIG nuclease family protein [Glaciimonas sp. GNP009]